MKIILNGAATDVKHTNLAEAMRELGYVNRLYATAINGEFIRLTLRDTYTLKDGDTVEIVSPRQGG